MALSEIDFNTLANVTRINFFTGEIKPPNGTNWVRVVNGCYNQTPITVEIDGEVFVCTVGNHIFVCKKYIKVLPNPALGLEFVVEASNENEESILASFFKEYPEHGVKFMKV